MKKTIKWTGNTITGVLMVAMLILVFFALSSKLNQDGVPKLGNYRMMVVLSGSMHPIFEAGDVVLDDAGTGKVLKKDDVITFKDTEDPKRIITHRIVEVIVKDNQISYKTKGDNNDSPDRKLVPQNNVIGTYIFHLPKVGYLINFAKTKQGFIGLIILPGLAIIISELRGIAKAITEEVERKKREVEASAWKKEDQTLDH